MSAIGPAKRSNNDNKLILKEIPSVASKRVRVMKKHVLIPYWAHTWHVLLPNIIQVGEACITQI